MNQLDIRLTGLPPGMLQHNPQTADPLNRSEDCKRLKELASKKQKTDDDYLEMSNLEWWLGLYLNDAGAPIIPAYVLEALMIDGAKKSSQGPKAKAGVVILDDARLEYGGPKSMKARAKRQDCRLYCGVVVNKARIFRTRPLFRDWSAVMRVNYDPGLLSRDHVIRAARNAGQLVGVGDSRPKYGRFDIEVL